MSDSPETTPQGAAPAAGEPVRVNTRILTQYIRDLSFENVVARKGITGTPQPELQVQVSLDARKRSDTQYEVITKLNLTSKTSGSNEVLFVLELEYAGVFHIEGVPAEQLHPYLLVECPRITFPFVRRIVADVARDGGFPTVNLDMIDFFGLYRNELARRAAAAKEGAEPAPQTIQ
ncbi:protein-export chaperone SecB [Ketogulonicigenium vulgare]|uniref:Protein-export protein SecB n=1 Tax=Ketogulonicigenium vulgare (strain WSH-001) TaxID=759362 RepID=F9Y694_KETVW|nr:protein-export chaperone SecB [Ketogulonicigenium vulgare]ADO43833.1 Preprotein translocase subunit SecB [Ketogulonicigenium vulgare Y25]AEM42091.1 Preprotein translocase subunit SecB [Ketogulonicigenium vulgare WSH-001]ALJ79720.1 preprotein translocase subunit SecB [Ketogulonicigenium vulgare]ANW32645.1 protein-export chaperone SecB [Ketogulonicigenium vulgare]AOZ55867.1 Preprotein translocase subunit SecB [Ketogulonicigenium vulgare]